MKYSLLRHRAQKSSIVQTQPVQLTLFATVAIGLSAIEHAHMHAMTDEGRIKGQRLKRVVMSRHVTTKLVTIGPVMH